MTRNFRFIVGITLLILLTALIISCTKKCSKEYAKDYKAKRMAAFLAPWPHSSKQENISNFAGSRLVGGLGGGLRKLPYSPTFNTEEYGYVKENRFLAGRSRTLFANRMRETWLLQNF